MLSAALQLAPASATQFFSSRSWYNPFSNLQLQSRIAQEYMVKNYCAQLLQCVEQPQAANRLARSVAESLMLCCAQPCLCVLSQPVANPPAGASLQIDQGSRIARIAMGTRPHKSGAAPNAAFFNALCEIDFSLQACTFFAGGIPRTETLLRQPPGAHYPKKRKKHRVSRTRAFSSVNSHVPDLSHFNYLMMVG